MVTRRVSHYHATWAEDINQSTISLFDGPDFITNIIPNSAIEFQVIIDLLRNERPVGFETNLRQIRVGFQNREPVGEEET